MRCATVIYRFTENNSVIFRIAIGHKTCHRWIILYSFAVIIRLLFIDKFRAQRIFKVKYTFIIIV